MEKRHVVVRRTDIGEETLWDKLEPPPAELKVGTPAPFKDDDGRWVLIWRVPEEADDR